MFIIFTLQLQDSAWENYAERIAKMILREGGKDAIYDIRFLEDSTGKYLFYYRRFIYTTPSGYKIFYKTPVLIRLPDDSPKDMDKMIISRIERESLTRENLLEIATIGFGCGVVTIGALIGAIFGLSR
jgi:hypothetical protein